MKISHLQIQGLRNLRNVRLDLHPRFNVICGPNGCGKTSILESLYLLGTGNSFRCRDTGFLVSHGEPCLTLFARADNAWTVSIRKQRNVPAEVRLNHEPCRMRSQLAHAFPMHVFYQDIFQIIDAGPVVRRALLDWGMFHVKQEYHRLWKSYIQVLKQRNCLLRKQASYRECVPWDKQLSEFANALDSLRQPWCEAWSVVFESLARQFVALDCTMRYYRGWDRKDQGLSLESVLKSHYETDLARQYTRYGAHHADIILQSTAVNPRYGFSRGQQKTILYALKLSQAQLLPDKDCIYLLDDFGSELDFEHQERVLSFLKTLNGQCVITTTQREILSPEARTLDAAWLDMVNGNVIIQ